jgi:hypothetical protein
MTFKMGKDGVNTAVGAATLNMPLLLRLYIRR